VTAFSDEHPHFGVEPVCEALGARPGGYYDCKNAVPSVLQLKDDELKIEIQRVFDENRKVYGFRKVVKQLKRGGFDISWCRVRRLMRAMGIEGLRRGRKHRTTKQDSKALRAPDLVDRDFTATQPNQLWVADFTYVPTWSGMVYVAFVADAFSRRIVGWRVSTSMTTDLVLDALEMAIWTRKGDVEGVTCHSDAGSQYTSIRYTERLQEAGAAPSIGSVGDAYDNAMAESTIGLYKTELINREGPWRSLEHVEIETLHSIDWFNNQRLHGELDHQTPNEAEQTYYRQQHNAADAA
jgi:putative transposase